MGELPASRRKADDRPAESGFRGLMAAMVQCGGDSVGPEHHAGTPTGGRIVHAEVAANAELPEVYSLELPDTCRQRLSDKR